MTIEQLQEKLKKFNPNDELIFYHQKNHNLEGCQLESIFKTDLGVELTIEELSDDNDWNNLLHNTCNSVDCDTLFNRSKF